MYTLPTISFDTPRVHISDADSVGKGELKCQTHMRLYIPRKKYLQQRSIQDNKKHIKEYTCEACRLNNHELYKTIREIHTSDLNECFLRKLDFFER